MSLVVLNSVILKPSANIQRLLFLASGFIIFFLIPFTIFAITNLHAMFPKNIKLILAGLLIIAGIWQFTDDLILVMESSLYYCLLFQFFFITKTNLYYWPS